MRHAFYIALFCGLIFGCSPSLNKTERPDHEIEHTESVEPITKVAKADVVQGCLSENDLDFIEKDILAIEQEIQSGNDKALIQRIQNGSNRVIAAAEMDERLTIVKEFFSQETMADEFKEEAELEKRFIQADDPACKMYLIIQNFEDSEFSYTFKMIKASGKLAFYEIGIIG